MKNRIDIIGNNKSNLWIKAILSHNFTIETIDGVKIALTEKLYYLDTKKNKIRYCTNNCNNASYDHLYNIWIEINPGIFAYTGNCTENSLYHGKTQAIKAFKRLTQSKIDNHIKAAKRY